MNIPIQDVHMREDVDGKYLEFFTCKDLPFGLQDTAQASWEYFKGAEKHMAYGNLYEKSEKNLDDPSTIIEKFKNEVYSNNSRADVKMRQVVRRYLESDRDFVIRVSHAAPIEIKNKMLRSPASTPTRESTQLQLCTQIALELKDGAVYDLKTVRGLTNFLIVHGKTRSSTESTLKTPWQTELLEDGIGSNDSVVNGQQPCDCLVMCVSR